MARFNESVFVLSCSCVLIISFYGCSSEIEERHKDVAKDWSPEWTTTLPDCPLQLVKPDVEHKKLFLIEENVKVLHKIQDAVATIAVVGKFHSGKSFLLNQLMGKSSGFGVGPSVRPQTMGIWMWGKPLEMSLSSGQKVSVIFLDTEGFAANNVSETYDAKIFSVATLLSSYLVYNSVKIIDQSDIDYLELLSRRTQLFALRSQISKAKWTSEFNHDLLSFPPLLWVVQDFVQLTENGESPRDWLHRLMGTHARDKEDYDISLLGMFRSVDCHTLFLPATKRELLIDLSRASEEDLTEDYKSERNQLIQTLKTGLKPKEKNNKPITGPELASLLGILVTAANDGSLAEIPSRWDTFIQRLEKSAKEDCLQFYEGEFEALSRRHDNGPVVPSELQVWHEHVLKQSVSVLEQLLFGLQDAVSSASELLQQEIMSRYLRAQDINLKKIKLQCTEVLHKLEFDAEQQLSEIKLPMRSHVLKEQISTLTAHCLKEYEKRIKKFVNDTIFQSFRSRLQSAISNLGESFLLKNKQAMENILEEGVAIAISTFRKGTEGVLTSPLKPTDLHQLTEKVQEHAIQKFEENCELADSESIYAVYSGMLRANLAEEVARLQKENEHLLDVEVKKKIHEYVDLFRDHTDTSHLSLPMNDSDLDTRLKQESVRLQTLYQDTLEDFSMMTSYKHGLAQLQKDVRAVCEQRRRENMEAYAREVKTPLSTAKQIVLISAQKYDTVFSLQQYILSVSLLNLNEGKPKHWPITLKKGIIQHYMETDEELRKLIASKQGLWSTLLGFIQWIFSLFTGSL